ncbi:type II secretion system minor pseudopilin GspI [Variovorax dokdonensis]|uniref:Type II secretion system protein I n=1 Tax=Variovorax dokdonensis TaxID=344883 RepID=A0ABT7NBN2_9BURK|nr:type II secretion system minor pseudopilin GspI [Variovorax dokdonensis]MDM0045339.1 type II secretion system minor pseudopilin GspI [Variovorax dokdonensis]
MKRASRRGFMRGFTLIEVLVALSIVALALAAGTQATSALVRNGQREADLVLAQLCAENQFAKLRLARVMPAIGDAGLSCEQAGRVLNLTVSTTATLNPNFRRVDVQVRDEENWPIIRLSTVVGRY